MSKQKLELTWIGKDKSPKLKRVFWLENPEEPYHAKHRVAEDGIYTSAAHWPSRHCSLLMRGK